MTGNRFSTSRRAVVTGAGGMIGGHLVARLLRDGTDVVAIDVKPRGQWWQWHPGAQNLQADAGELAPHLLLPGDDVYHLAEDMGGIGHIETHRFDCSVSATTAISVIRAAAAAGAARLFYSSSACVYNTHKQTDPDVTALAEPDAYPSLPEHGYGEAKLFIERVCQYAHEDLGLETRVARYHNVYGPCFDEATEVLTDDGWKPFPDISKMDRIATLRQDTGLLEFHRPTAIQAYEYEGPMYRVSHQSADLLVTPDHSIYYATRTRADGSDVWSEYRLGKVRDSGWCRARMRFSCAVAWEGEDRETHVLPEAFCSNGATLRNRGGSRKELPLAMWLRFAGWYIAEGSAWVTPSNHTVCVTQDPGPGQDEIVALLRDMGFRPHVSGRDVIVSSKQLYEAVQPFGRHARSKRIPRDLLGLPSFRLKELFAGLMAGDGDADGGRYSTVSRQLADDVMELALKLGLRATIRRDGNMLRVCMSDRVNLDTRREHRTIEHYSGRVYDVTVPNHILLVRRDGKAMWSGNCGTFSGGREKAPAALCRKIATAAITGDHRIEVWGDGEQTRSFMAIEDCVEGTLRIQRSDVHEPLNLGSSELVTINQLAHLIATIAGIDIVISHDLDAPKGVRGRNSDNTLIRQHLGWEPSITLRAGLERTYAWVYDQLHTTLTQAASS